MAELVIHIEKIQNNIRFLSEYFSKHRIDWSLITKVFSGDKEFLSHLLTPEIIQKINSIGDSRLLSLKNLKELNPDMITIYIRPPAKLYADEMVKYADISLNSSYSTIHALNEAARKVNKVHKIIIMVEMGELREGVHQDDLVNFYEKVFDLSHIEVIGIGSNLGCMYGIAPDKDKLLQLTKYKKRIESKFNCSLKYISGGTSITLPMVEDTSVPEEINHFRIGEAVFFGLSPLKNERFLELSTDTFEFKANIIELEEKKIVPEGIVSDSSIGVSADYEHVESDATSTKAILDFGILDVDQENIKAVNNDLQLVGVTSDMLVADIGDNKTESGEKKYSVGDVVYFKPNYMAVARLLSSRFVEKRFV